jgi:hypothetical protein
MAGRKAANTGFAGEDAVETNDAALTTIALEAFKIEKYEVQDLGNKLPIGLFHPETGERLQEFTLNPYKTNYDRQLGALLNAPQSQTRYGAGKLPARDDQERRRLRASRPC